MVASGKLVNIQKAMENHHLKWVNQLYMAIYNGYVTGWWFLVAMNLALSHEYWVSIIIPIDSYFSEGWPNHQPDDLSRPALGFEKPDHLII